MEATLCCLLWLCFLIIFLLGLFSQKAKLQVIALWVFELLFQTNLSNLFLVVAVIITFVEKLCGPPKFHTPDSYHYSVLIGAQSISFVVHKDVWVCWRIPHIRRAYIYMTFHKHLPRLPSECLRPSSLPNPIVLSSSQDHDKICLKLGTLALRD